MADSNAVEAVAYRPDRCPDGYVEGLKASQTIVDVSTIAPAASHRLARDARARGADLVDHEFLSAAAGMGLADRDFAVIFAVLAQMSGVSA